MNLPTVINHLKHFKVLLGLALLGFIFWILDALYQNTVLAFIGETFQYYSVPAVVLNFALLYLLLPLTAIGIACSISYKVGCEVTKEKLESKDNQPDPLEKMASALKEQTETLRSLRFQEKAQASFDAHKKSKEKTDLQRFKDFLQNKIDWLDRYSKNIPKNFSQDETYWHLSLVKGFETVMGTHEAERIGRVLTHYNLNFIPKEKEIEAKLMFLKAEKERLTANKILSYQHKDLDDLEELDA